MTAVENIEGKKWNHRAHHALQRKNSGPSIMLVIWVAPTPKSETTMQVTETRQRARGQELPISEVPGLWKWQIPRERMPNSRGLF